MTKFTFIDVEALWDEDLHRAYLAIDPAEADKRGRNSETRRRVPCKRICAAAAFDVEIGETGAISVLGLSSWTEHDHGDELEVVSNLFAHLRANPTNHVVTYGGFAAELPLFNLAAFEYDLVLPEQLRSTAWAKPGQWRPHIDLGLEIKGKGREWAHLTEMGLRLGIPGALFVGKPDIAEPRSNEEWQELRQRVSMDCVLTAMIALAFWRANGRVRLDQAAMLHAVSAWCLRRQIASGQQAIALKELQEAMLEKIVEQVAEAA